MKIHVCSFACVNTLRCYANGSMEPTHYIHSILPEIPLATAGRFNGSRWNSIKELKEKAHSYGLSVYPIKRN